MFRSSIFGDLFDRFFHWSQLCNKHELERTAKSPFLRVLSFAEVIHTEVGLTGPGSHSGETGFFTWPKSFLEPTGFAASRAHRRWTTPLFTPPDALSPRISIANMGQRMSSSAWTLANPARISPHCLPRVSCRLAPLLPLPA